MMLIDLSMPMVSPVLHSFSFGTSTHPVFFLSMLLFAGEKCKGHVAKILPMMPMCASLAAMAT